MRVGGPRRASRQQAVVTQAFFGWGQAKSAAGPDPRGKEIAAELIKLTQGTDYGSKASEQRKEDIAEAAANLSKYCIKNPLKSPQLWGDWQVLYSSKPSAVGGPLRQGPGPTVFPGQDARQILVAPNKLINQVEFKTLGFVPGYSKQLGEINPISSDTFVLSIKEGELKTGLGGPEKKVFNIERKIQILYLDEELRVARFLPTAGLEDDEAGAKGAKQGAKEEILFVFRRKASPKARAAASDSDSEDEDAAPKRLVPKSGTFIFNVGGSKPAIGIATQAERQARARAAEPAARPGTQMRAPPAPTAKPAPAPARPSFFGARPTAPAAAAAPVPGGTVRVGTRKSDLPPSLAARTQASTARVGTQSSPIVGSQRVAARPVSAPARLGSQRVAAAALAETPVQKRAREAAESRARAADAADAARARQADAAAAAKAKAADAASAAKNKQAEAAAQARAAEDSKKARAAEEAKRAIEAKASKDKADAEKRAAAERAGAIRELLAKLGEEIKERGNEARRAVAATKDLERSSGMQLKAVAAAKGSAESAEQEVAEVSEALGQATSARKEAEGSVKEAQAALASAQRALSDRMAALSYRK